MGAPSEPDPRAARQARIGALGWDYDAQPREPVGACSVCGPEGRPVEAASRDRYGFETGLFVCRRCGLGWLSPRMTAAAYAGFYAAVYRPLVSAYHGRRIDAETVQEEQAAYGEALGAYLARRLPAPPRTLLDMGGSTGVVAAAIATRFGAAATVVDPAPDELAVARAAGIETVAGFAEDYDAQGRTWDLVMLCQAIDHLLDARRALSALRRMTAPGGRAFVDIVDIGLLLGRVESIEALVKVDHPYYFSRSSAIALFSLSGYRVVAERVRNDGHRGFVLEPREPVEPDWGRHEASAAKLLGRLGVAPAG